MKRTTFRKSKKRWQPKPDYKCKWCGGSDHYAMACFQNPKKGLNIESKSHKRNRDRLTNIWMSQNKPDESGYWTCYLRISPECPVFLEESTVTLEHVMSKTRHPKLRWRTENILPACMFCNELKGSLSVQELAVKYPVLKELIESPGWREYDAMLSEIEASL